MSRNNQTNSIIKYMIVLGDFVLLNSLMLLLRHFHPNMAGWSGEMTRGYFLICNLALLICVLRSQTVAHGRLVSGEDILKRVVKIMTTQTIISYLLLKPLYYQTPVGKVLLLQGLTMIVLLLMLRLIERSVIKWYRQKGGNIRTVTLVGDDRELENVKEKLEHNATLGYRIMAEFKDPKEFMGRIDAGEIIDLGDELFLCISNRENEVIRRISRLCDQHVVSFFYIPQSVESLGMSLKREMLEDIEIYTSYENPLQNPINSLYKRVLDICFSAVMLVFVIMLLPFIAIIIKCQSKGPVFFSQKRSGLDGKEFSMFKFRSMHVNKERDTRQTTKDDPRKFPFGSLMRKTSIDELPQFWNVLKGDMSIVGPRPHMLAHTEMYSKLIDKYMVRHFVKPGITGWAQVMGFRGETKELWQMEERVRHDIWYIEHWTIWLDFRILWLTAKNLVMRDKNAY